MAVPILQVLAEGRSLTDTQALTDVVRGWLRWMPTSPDVGAQTRAVLSGLGPDATEQDAREAARRHHEARGRSAGNGSLMRTGPLALGYLADGAEAALAEAEGRSVNDVVRELLETWGSAPMGSQIRVEGDLGGSAG